MTDEEIKNKERATDEARKKKVSQYKQDAEEKYKKYSSRDPFPDIAPALLNSADIYNYVRETGMIYPFYPEDMSVDTYEVAIGDKIIWWNEEEQKKDMTDLSKAGTSFELKPNSIAFVSLEPYFQIPHYMALSFNLKISHVYKGLLLGTGPLVDPGFVGKLSIPLHNLTANTYIFRHGDKMITMEFTKLSPNEAWENSTSQPLEDVLYKRNWIKPGRSVDNYIDKALERSSDKMVRSSIPHELKEVRSISQKAKDNVKKAKKDLDRRLRNQQLITVLTLVPVLAFATTALYQLGSANSIKKEQLWELQEQNENLQKQYEQLAKDFEEYKKKVTELEAKKNEDPN